MSVATPSLKHAHTCTYTCVHTLWTEFKFTLKWSPLLPHLLREIRQEVSFLAQLDHPNLTKLCGVRTSPHMCLLLELAPHDSLCHTLKVYKKYEVVLGPVTLQASIHQVCGELLSW